MDAPSPEVTPEGIRLYAPEDFAGMHKAGRLAAEILDMMCDHVAPGVTTGALDKIVEDFVTASGAKSATIGYRGYQHATCISVNHVVCHGIPGSEIPKSKYEKFKRGNDVLVEGDILNIDVTVIVDGWFGDNSRMYIVGKPKDYALRLIDVTHEALMRGIEAARPGNTFGDIGHAIQRYAEGQRCSVVRDFCGHGLGREFHEQPNVMHFGRPGEGAELRPGMFFTIEPMINLGRYETRTLSDKWTAVTRDGALSAQFEHGIGITETGNEIFTLSPAGKFHPTWDR